MSDATRMSDEAIRALMRHLLLREAEASVRLDKPESGVHTCHEDCPCQKEGDDA